MIKKLLLSVGIIVATQFVAFSQSGTLKGKITDSETKESIPFANVVIESGGKQYGGSTTDFDGNYTIKPIPPGKYDVKATYVGYKPILIRGVVINADKIVFNNITMEATVTTLETFEVVDYKVPLISKDQTTSGETVTAEEIAKIPGRSAQSVAVTVGGVFSQDGEMGSIRGQRTDGTVTYIDGIRVRGSSSLPKSAIEEVSVLTGGLSAKYGEATGGILNIVTKGPSRDFGGSVEFETSELLDKYGYNVASFSLTGPLIKSKDPNQKTSLLGFFISGEGTLIKDPSPSAIGLYRAKNAVLQGLEKEPLRPSGTGNGSFSNSEFIRLNDLENIKAKENANYKRFDFSGKIDVRTTENTNLTFGGSLSYTDRRLWSYSNSLFNSENNGQGIYNTWRVFGKFTQRFPAEKDSKSLIKNVFYQIQADFSKYHSTIQDVNFKDNFFEYGYVGKFETYKTPYYELGDVNINGKDYTNVWLLTNFYDTLVTFQPSEINPNLSNYTSQYYDRYDLHSGYYQNYTYLQNGRALLNGDLPDAVYGLWSNTGTPYNYYNKYDQNQIGVNANGSADVGNHAIEFGIQYEQLVTRSYELYPAGLWTLMRQLANRHIAELDLDNPIIVTDAYGVFQDTIKYNRLYDAASQANFDRNARTSLGYSVNGTDWVDVDSYDPSRFSIDMFSADELLNNGISYVSYYGYDHHGNKLSSKPSFDDFFTAKDEYGNYKREIGAFEPIYTAGYIQDKFAFKDLIFNIGIRVDRFDANQMVLKDPYLLFPAKTVKEVSNLGTHPSNMGSDYVVYVDDANNPQKIMGYRNGDTWYNASGAEVEDPSVLSIGTSTGSTTPYLVDPSNKTLSSSSFKDYEPQTTFMPRIAFSFPISDEALFFAHYDVITKRPTTGLRMDPTQYYFLEAIAGSTIINNPNLKPEKTIDYELGFQQKLSNSSSLKFSAYYRELRDLVQSYRFSEAYPISYISFNNIDFGTVKGLSIQYDLRRSNNIRVRTSYNLQFANGTGSDALSGVNLVNTGQPNLRTIFPLSYDQRHQIKVNLDFRYDEGKKYNGPTITKKIKGTDKVKTVPLFENTGLNVTFNGGSGVPYSKQSNVTSGILSGGNPQLQGSINGSRLPWQFWIDARIDRDIELKWGKNKEGKKVSSAYLNIYLQVTNILNTKNTLFVYQSTGNPDDDGYLNAPEFQNGINSQNDPQAFRDLYSIKVNDPSNYSLPRQIHLGASLNF